MLEFISVFQRVVVVQEKFERENSKSNIFKRLLCAYKLCYYSEI